MVFGALFGLAMFTHDALGAILEPFKETLWDEWIEAGLRLLKWEFLRSVVGLRVFYGTFDDLTEAEPNILMGYSPGGLTNIFDFLIRASLYLSAFMGEEMAEEILLELLQEGVSNAIQTSIGGAFQTIMNVYRGGQPIYGDDIANMPSYWNNVDDKINVFNVASSGMNYLGSLHYLLQGVHSNTDDMFREVYHTLTSISTRAVEEELWWILTYMELARNNILQRLRDIADITQRYVEIAIDVLEDGIGRCNDMIQEIETEISRLDSGMTTEDNSQLIKDELEAEFDALKRSIDEAYNNLLNHIDNVQHTLITEDINEYKNALNMYRDAIREMMNTVNKAYIDYLNEQYRKVYNILDMLLCYRFYSDTHQYSDEEVAKTKVLQLVEGKVTTTPYHKLTVKVYESGEQGG